MPVPAWLSAYFSAAEPEPEPFVYDHGRPSLLDLGAREVLLHVCSFLTAHDLGRMASVSRSFGAATIRHNATATTAAPRRDDGRGTSIDTLRDDGWSVAEEAARRWLENCTEQERGWVPRRGPDTVSWLSIMREVEVLRRAAAFGRSHESVTLSEGGARATRGEQHGHWRAAASNAVMRAGRHCAQFTVTQGITMIVGVIRPGHKDVESGGAQSFTDGHCFYSTYGGHRWPGRNWEGRCGAEQVGDCIGLLFDADQGSMTVYKNDERLGELVPSGSLSAREYCWAVAFGEKGDCIEIQPAALPLPPPPLPPPGAKAEG